MPFRPLLRPVFEWLFGGERKGEHSSENAIRLVRRSVYDRGKDERGREDLNTGFRRDGEDIISRRDTETTFTEIDLDTTKAFGHQIADEEKQVEQNSETSAMTNQTSEGQLTFMALLTLLMFLFIFILQFIGLVKAIQGMRVPNLKATWCSPDFQPGVLAVIDGNCTVHMLNESSSSGIGCAGLPAFQQMSWLVNTVTTLSLSLLFQVLDLCVLSLSDGKDRICYKKVKLQWPWLTTFAGMVVLIVLASAGVNYANNLPEGITARVLVLRTDLSLKVFPACEGRLVSLGLRGAVIG